MHVVLACLWYGRSQITHYYIFLLYIYQQLHIEPGKKLASDQKEEKADAKRRPRAGRPAAFVVVTPPSVSVADTCSAHREINR
ncbi:hypothetical protein BDA96_04G206000 [Sorghum bicolor]|jgi:hypothetical protein|uniref:Uncharacterized protein n=1 Tax=Sorghum bicolor TaxID=4558 RepID=A0A921R4W5_SORBI|nr:hypothetical protein BDA96_04G206000 [Sorghum bicolor]